MDSVLSGDAFDGDRPGSRLARSLTANPALADLATDLLRTDAALADLDADEASCVVAYMGLVLYPPGATVFREGDASRTSYLLLILNGEVSVETAAAAGSSQVTISVLGPGNIIGEMGLIDGSPRSATCTATSALQTAGLTRKSLQRLIDENPKVGAKLMIGLCKRLADRLRGLNDQLQLYAQLNASLQQQVERLSGRSRF
ncbi:MAG: cyclic nucleotide-binding domain-containing protein [Ideonella sp.]